MNAKRPSPSESATLFSVGTSKIGNDGNYWKVILTKNNTKRWKKESQAKTKTPKTRSKQKKSKPSKAPKKAKKAKSVKTKKSKAPKTKSKKAKKAKSVKTKKSKSVKRKSKKVKKSKSVKTKKSKSVKRKSKKVKKSRSVKTKKSKSVKRKSKKVKKSKSVKTKKSKSVKRKSKKVKKSKSVKSKTTSKPERKESIKQTKPELESKPEHEQKHFNKNTFLVMLANKYAGNDPTGYFMSEKLDGYRALFYNGPNGGELFSRNNKPFIAPQWFLDDISQKLPKGILLDGELYTKRGDFEGMGVVRKKTPVDSDWRKITYMVFDLPLVRKPFKERYNMLKDILQDVPHVKLVEHIEIKNQKQFEDLHKELVDNGAEGTMLRHPDSYYENKRSNMLLKVKDFLDDEAVVEGMEFGDGRNSNVMGNLIVKWAPHANKSYKGTFDVGSGFTDEHRKNWKTLFKKGTMITVKYFEIQKSGKPRFPIFQNIYHKI
jgi:DNA ligase-1